MDVVGLKKIEKQDEKPDWYDFVSPTVKALYDHAAEIVIEAEVLFKTAKNMEELAESSAVKISTDKSFVSINKLEIARRAGKSHSNITKAKAKGLVDFIEQSEAHLNAIYKLEKQRLGLKQKTKTEVEAENSKLKKIINELESEHYRESFARLQDMAFLESSASLHRRFQDLQSENEELKYQLHKYKKEILSLEKQLAETAALQLKLDKERLECARLGKKILKLQTELSK
ncbi:MAG: hypothetical protein DSZ27_02625 [Thiomicrospira sp.]|nr:MAG: hypothetical protein DSZ27_02625 [Thiomicrospira sp.]